MLKSMFLFISKFCSKKDQSSSQDSDKKRIRSCITLWIDELKENILRLHLNLLIISKWLASEIAPLLILGASKIAPLLILGATKIAPFLILEASKIAPLPEFGASQIAPTPAENAMLISKGCIKMLDLVQPG